MDNASPTIADKIQELGDIELAVLLCLVAEQHCIISAQPEDLDALEQELRLICLNVFGLSWASVGCSEKMSVDEFGDAILVEDDDDGGSTPKSEKDMRKPSYLSSDFQHPAQRSSQAARSFSALDTRIIANVVVAKNLHFANHHVQTQALELIRSKRIFTRTAAHAAPHRFLFVALLSAEDDTRLIQHLNDHFCFSHFHTPEDGLPNLEEVKERESFPDDDDASASSVLRTTSSKSHAGEEPTSRVPVFSNDDIDALVALSDKVRISAEVRAYLHNIIVFMRMHRAVAGGISALATRHFNSLVRALAPLHNLSYIPPSIVALAARKIYPHRIILTTPEKERSMQWGSSLEAVREVLAGVTVEDVVEEVLQSVETPL